MYVGRHHSKGKSVEAKNRNAICADHHRVKKKEWGAKLGEEKLRHEAV